MDDSSEFTVDNNLQSPATSPPEPTGIDLVRV